MKLRLQIKACSTPFKQANRERTANYYEHEMLSGRKQLYEVPLWLMRDPEHCRTLATIGMRSVRCKGPKRFEANLREILRTADVIEDTAKCPDDLLCVQMLRRVYHGYLFELEMMRSANPQD